MFTIILASDSLFQSLLCVLQTTTYMKCIHREKDRIYMFTIVFASELEGPLHRHNS